MYDVYRANNNINQTHKKEVNSMKFMWICVERMSHSALLKHEILLRGRRKVESCKKQCFPFKRSYRLMFCRKVEYG